MREHQEPGSKYLLSYLITLSIGALVISILFRTAPSKKDVLRSMGVSLRKVARATREIERKSFHLCGLLMPLIYQALLRMGVSNATCVRVCIAITAVGWACDLARLRIGVIARNWPMRRILRESEMTQLTGACWFSLGCTLCIAISPPSISTASIIFLILGDLSAAIIGVSFGGEAVAMKLGRRVRAAYADASARRAHARTRLSPSHRHARRGRSRSRAALRCSLCASSSARLCSRRCVKRARWRARGQLVVPCAPRILPFSDPPTPCSQVHLREYPVFLGAVAATLTEL